MILGTEDRGQLINILLAHKWGSPTSKFLSTSHLHTYYEIVSDNRQLHTKTFTAETELKGPSVLKATILLIMTDGAH